MIVGATAILGVLLLAYQPVLGAGFWTDDYGLLGYAARMSPWNYFAFYFDPRLQTIWYRPLQGMELGLAYVFFRADPFGYHLLQLCLHLVNCLLLFGLVTRVTRNWRAGLLSGLIYAALPAYDLAVYWATVAEPLLALFAIVAVWWWIDYLEAPSRRGLVLTYFALVCALLTKEVAAVLPVVFFLADILLVRKRTMLNEMVKRYAPFLLVLAVYGLLEYQVIAQGVYTRDSGYGIGSHVIPIAVEYLTRLSFPWGIDPPLSYLWLALILGSLAFLSLKRKWGLVFLAAAGVLTIAPVVPFRVVSLRYMYLPLMATAATYGVLVEYILRAASRLSPRYVASGAPALALTIVVLANGQAVSDGAESFSGYSREQRLEYRPIFQEHPTLAHETLFYFVDPPILSWNLNGLVTLRYGANVTASGLDYDVPAGLREHQVAFAVYRDDQNNLRDQTVDPLASVRTAPSVPVQFENSISLNGFELVSNRVARGGAIILLVYWGSGQKIGVDYAVFAHLVDETGQMVAGSDSQPKRGAAPTSSWNLTGREIVDAIVVPIDQQAPIGDHYRLQVGWYDPATMRRLSTLDGNGQPMGDSVVFDSFSITP